MKEERLKKEKQDMLGFYDYTVVLTYISLAVSVFGMTRALEGDFKVAILCLALSGLCREVHQQRCADCGVPYCP